MCLTGWEFYFEARARYNGHLVWVDQDSIWWYESDGVCIWADRFRACPVCGLRPTPEKHDGCLGELPGVRFACCGHGHPEEANVTLDDPDRTARYSWEAIDYFCAQGRPPAWLSDPDTRPD